MNVAILIGRLVADPELRYIPSTGKAVVTLLWEITGVYPP